MKNGNWHPYTSNMTLSCFQQLWLVLHFSYDTNIQESNDSLHKVRPNTLKMTMGFYIELGSKLSLDKASIACKSKYGRDCIVYSKNKPKRYHFRFYLLCDSTAGTCVQLQMHMKDSSDDADGYNNCEPDNNPGEDDEQIEEVEDDTELEDEGTNTKSGGKKKKKRIQQK